jgi:hypothetical protein
MDMKTIVATLFGILVSSIAVAQPPGGAGGGMPDNATIMANNDGNGDGEITRAEATEAGLALGQNWDMFDLNTDGKVVAEELDQVRGQFAGGSGAGAPPAPPAPPAAPAPPAPPAPEADENE